jgi:hypothetical protein
MPRTILPLLAALLASSSFACSDAGMNVPVWHRAGYGGGGTPGSSGGTPGSSGVASSGSGSGGTGATGSSGSGSGGGTSNGGSSSGVPMPTASYSVSMNMPSLTMQLMASESITVSVAPNGYTGMVQLAPGALPTGVTAKLTPDTLTLDGMTTADVKLELATDPSAPPATSSLDISVTSPAGSKSATLSLDVTSVITIHIPKGVDNNGGTINNPVTDAYGPYPIAITAPQAISGANPVTVYFFNDDNVSHEIHAGAPSQGFGHDPGPFGPNQMDPYVRHVNSKGQYDFYLHDQNGPGTIGRVVVQ